MGGRALPKGKQGTNKEPFRCCRGGNSEQFSSSKLCRQACSARSADLFIMALSVSRTPALRFRLQSTNSTPFASCTPTWRVASRTYATESAVYSKRRGAGASAKATHKATNVSSAAPKRTSTKVEERAAGHAGANSAVADVKALAGSSKAQLTKTPPVTSQDAAAPIETDEMKQLKELEAIEYFKKVMKSADPFGQPIAETLGASLSQNSRFATHVLT